jgi:branched-chain amino acid transport system permease protein
MSPELASAIVGVLDLGSLYALVGVGFVILYRSTKVFNFAQGAFMLLGGEMFDTLLVKWHVAWYFAIPISMAVLAAIGAAVYLLFFRRLVGADLFVLVIATLGLNVVLTTVSTLIWGPDIKIVPEVLSFKALVSVGAFQIAPIDVLTVAVAAAIIIVMEGLLTHTKLGIQMRAVADGPLLAGQIRISVHRISAIAWAIAALCAGAAGAVYSMRVAVDPAELPALGLLAFPALFLGGLDSIRGALVGGFILAAVQNATIFWVGGLWSDVVPYGVLLLVLLVRPNGIFGSRQVVRL